MPAPSANSISDLLTPELPNDLGPPSPPGNQPAPDPSVGSVDSAAVGPADILGTNFPAAFGTSVAQQESTMKKAEKTPKNAGGTEQNLPGTSALSAGHGGAVSVSAPALPLPSAPAMAVAASADSRLLALEKTHDLVALHALRLTQLGTDNLRVVIEPGGGTRLSLELRFAGGGVQAHAQLHRGDFEFLNQHWTELQQRLEPRGVHLGPLECSTGSPGDQRRSPEPFDSSADDGPLPSAFAEVALDPAITPSRAAKSQRTRYNGWETWA
ncbi:MAG TPA: hypothetical protein VFE51_17315 [Verrucomicrobiae bacterium]|nr:hypothetical protein [Verrucomicrobiae bacterium]